MKYMNRIARTHRNIRGITLIEVMIFSVLLSFLISNLITYFFTIQSQNIKLLDQIQREQRGFVATTAVVLLATGMIVFVLITLSATAVYSDSVFSREVRIQRKLNAEACEDYAKLIKAKDYFFKGTVKLEDLDCSVSG